MNFDSFLLWAEGLDLSPLQYRMLMAVKAFEHFKSDFPSIPALADHCRLGQVTVRHNLRFLVLKGYIIRQEILGYASVYTISEKTLNIRKPV